MAWLPKPRPHKAISDPETPEPGSLRSSMQARRLAKRPLLGGPCRPGGRDPGSATTQLRLLLEEDSRLARHREQPEADEPGQEAPEEEPGVHGFCTLHMDAKGPVKAGRKDVAKDYYSYMERDGKEFKGSSSKREMAATPLQGDETKREAGQKMSDQQVCPLGTQEEDARVADTKRHNSVHESEKDSTRSICLLEQKRKVVSSNIDVPRARKSAEEAEMDKVTAAMVLTSLSTSPLVRSPPVRPNECLNGSWKDGGGVPSSTSSSGYWSWSAPSDQSNPSTPSPPLSADCFKLFRAPTQSDDGIDEADASSLLFDEPIPRKRKNSMKVMFKCLWKNCGKVLSTAAGIQKHIRTVHLGRNGESEFSDGEEDFYYTEIRLNTDSVVEGQCSVSPVSPCVASPPPVFPTQDVGHTETGCIKAETKSTTPLSHSAPTKLYLIHTDHAYQATSPVNIPGSAKFTPNGNNFSISWQSPPVTFTGTPVSPTHTCLTGSAEQRPSTHTVMSSPPRALMGQRKPRGEGKKCRKVYGMENRDMWCTACRWKKACQRFVD